ncbi:MAG: class I SAM-dependent methyltransferase [Candidatus Rokubacteria bacterium]|nr:class I SAM-dependent methyltransferase [Candidatus Rokubacteria bacterium]
MTSGPWRFLLYIVLPQPAKMAFLPRDLKGQLDRINLAGNVGMYSGRGATAYDATHRYAEAEHHEYPAQQLVEDVWPGRGYGRALELGAGSGYFTRLIASRADTVTAVEPVPDMQRVLREGCEAYGIGNVEILGVSAAELPDRLPPHSVDSVLVIQSLHHMHRRPEVFEALGRVLRPGGRLLMVEPHHNLRRIARLARKWLRYYRAREYWSREINWGTHDFLTCGEIRALCRHGGFERPRMTGYWFPYTSRLVPDPARRFHLESHLGRLPGVRHMAGVLAIETRLRATAAP